MIQQPHFLDSLFHPESIAIIGASANPTSKGYDYLKGMLELGFPGRIYPINMRAGEVLGLKAYPRIKDIPGQVDYVISCIDAQSAVATLADCALKGAKAIQLYTSGFSETGEADGIALERELLQRANDNGMHVIGPNCIGLHYPKGGLAFGRAKFSKKGGPVGGLIQSGGHAWHLVSSGSLRGLGFSKVISFGNACDLNEADFLEYLGEDPETGVIGAYIEGIKDGHRFAEVARETSQAKPLIMLKGGRTDAGKRAVASHTGSMAGSDTIWNAFFEQNGIIRVYSLDELIDCIIPFVFFPPIKKGTVGIVGGGGGASVQAADDLEMNGLQVPSLPGEIRNRLRQFTPVAGSSLANPVDTAEIWDIEKCVRTFELVGSWEDVDLMLAHAVVEMTAQWQGQTVLDNIIEGLLISRETIKKPIAVILQSYGTYRAAATLHEIQKKLAGSGIPVYPSAGRAANAISKFIHYNKNH